MNSLAFNMHISQILRGKYQFGLAVLPIGLMFSSFLVLWPFTYWLSEYLGIPEGAPVKDQPNGLLWIVVFLSTMVALMILGYLIGWVLNAAITRTVLGWDSEKTRRVFLYSEVPNEWLKEGQTSSNANTPNAVNEAWAATRKKGKWNYILTKGVLGWGAFMYFFMAVLPVVRGSEEQTAFYFIWNALLWGASGALFGTIIWHFSEKQYIKALNEKSPNRVTGGLQPPVPTTPCMRLRTGRFI